MSDSVDIVHAFWEECWNAHDPAAVDRFVVDLHLEVLESFQNADVWAVREDGKLLSNHVERAALEQLQRLTRST